MNTTKTSRGDTEMSDRQLRARVSEDIVEEVERIAAELEQQNPGVEANISTITRYAIHDYIRRYNGKKNGTVFMEVPLGSICNEDLEIVFKSITEIREVLSRNAWNQLPGMAHPHQAQIDVINNARMTIAELSEKASNSREARAERRGELLRELEEQQEQ